MQVRIVRILTPLPWLVCEDHGKILGYSCASAYRGRAAYRWSANTSIYIHESARGRSIGRALSDTLFRILVLQGYYNAFAAISLPNPQSVALHEAFGFEPIGVYRKVLPPVKAYHTQQPDSLGCHDISQVDGGASQPETSIRQQFLRNDEYINRGIAGNKLTPGAEAQYHSCQQ